MSDDFTLRQVSPDDWMITDERFEAADARHLVACISEEDGAASVRWFRHVALPRRFRDRCEAIAALMAAEGATPALA